MTNGKRKAVGRGNYIGTKQILKIPRLLRACDCMPTYTFNGFFFLTKNPFE